MASCAAFLCTRPPLLGRAAALTGVVVTTLMIVIKVLPHVPGHFTIYERIALAVWVGSGLVLRRRTGEVARNEESG